MRPDASCRFMPGRINPPRRSGFSYHQVMSDTRLSTEHRHQGSAVETVQSLIVAFVLAMTFRGFVTEGFVIPTGSMAPTLMGQHLLLHSDQTGVTYPIDTRRGRRSIRAGYDPMLGRKYPLDSINISALRPRMGDRILVLKCLYPFAEPQRFDVVVFKNPTDPDGDAENYIKRRLHVGIGGDKAQHGRHVRVDHANAFGGATERNCGPVELH